MDVLMTAEEILEFKERLRDKEPWNPECLSFAEMAAMEILSGTAFDSSLQCFNDGNPK